MRIERCFLFTEARGTKNYRYMKGPGTGVFLPNAPGNIMGKQVESGVRVEKVFQKVLKLRIFEHV